MSSAQTLVHEIKEALRDYLGHHDNEVVKIALEYFSAECSVTHTENRLAKIIKLDVAFLLASSLHLVYRKYLAYELKFLAKIHDKEKNMMSTPFSILRPSNARSHPQYTSLLNQHRYGSIYIDISHRYTKMRHIFFINHNTVDSTN